MFFGLLLTFIRTFLVFSEPVPELFIVVPEPVSELFTFSPKFP